jgi:hypothetical protein
MDVDPKYVSNLQEIKEILSYVSYKKIVEWKPTLATMDTLSVAKYVLGVADFPKNYPEWCRRLRFLCDAETVHTALIARTE